MGVVAGMSPPCSRLASPRRPGHARCATSCRRRRLELVAIAEPVAQFAGRSRRCSRRGRSSLNVGELEVADRGSARRRPRPARDRQPGMRLEGADGGDRGRAVDPHRRRPWWRFARSSRLDARAPPDRCCPMPAARERGPGGVVDDPVGGQAVSGLEGVDRCGRRRRKTPSIADRRAGRRQQVLERPHVRAAIARALRGEPRGIRAGRHDQGRERQHGQDRGERHRSADGMAHPAKGSGRGPAIAAV